MLNGISPRGDRGKFMTMFVVEETASTYSLINRGGICKMHFVTITNLEWNKACLMMILHQRVQKE